MDRNSVKEQIGMAGQRFDRLFAALSTLHNLAPGLFQQARQEVVDVLGAVSSLAETSDEGGAVSLLNPVQEGMQTSTLRDLERELVDSRQDYQTIFNSVPLRIWYFDKEGKILRINDFALRFLEMSREQVLGKTLEDLFSTQAQSLKRLHQQVISSGTPLRGTVEKILLPRGRWRWIRVDRIPFKNSEGQISGVIVLVDDITDEKQNEDALRESQRMLSTLMGNLPGMAYRCLNDDEWTMIFISEGCLKLTGYQPDELIGNRKVSYTQLVHPDDREWVRRYIQSALDQKTSFQCTYRIITAGGKEKSVLEQGCGVYGSDGTLETIEGFINDVTDRLRAQEALHASESFLKSIFGSMADAVFCFDVAGRFVLYNIPSDKKSFLPSGNFAGRRPADVFPARVAELFREGFESNRVNQVASGDFFMEADHTQAWFSSKISPIFLDGEYKGSVAVVRNISDRKKIEQALHESEARYRSFVQSFHGIAFRSDKMCKPSEVYGEVEMITGYTLDEFIKGNISWGQLLHPDDRSETEFQIENFIQGTQTTFDQEFRIIRKDGQVRWIRQMVHRLPASNFHDLCFQGAMYDITETKRVEAQLNQYREKMIRAEHMASLGTLGSAIAHQLNQPLTAIRLFLQQSQRTLEKNVEVESVKERIQDSLAEINNATGIISRFLRYTHLQPEAMRQKVSLASVANKIASIMADRARWARVVLELKNLDKMPEIEGNEGEIEQIFFILIQNAIQAAETEKPAHLEISARFIDDRIELYFADTCCGISPENLQKLFLPFFTTKTEGQGTGLGLCILNRIVTRYDGKVDVQSQLGIGTTFTVTLPVHT